MSDIFLHLYEKYKFICEVKEYKSTGHLCLYIQNINPKFIKKNLKEILEFIFLLIKKALEISNKYGKKLFCSHVYLENASNKNFNLILFKKINNAINKMGGDDILETCYIYNSSSIMQNIYNIIKIFIPPDTRKKILFVK
ncbi:MAG: hypothetical protein CMA27_01245 [Euryarchaeota archaeon]|nr:hypothetical protein [Euryarchaeota archaeon]|tara:strand:+ start:880 stop:1299 length:420 start_codon:yes stop_codon:yes gene_type:complete